jgi:catechol 2,3-dioxygenase-like lactoylglutathione lyase family enzyme
MTVSSIEETQRFYARHFGLVPSERPFAITDGWFGTGVARDGAHVKIGWLSQEHTLIELHEYTVGGNTRRLDPHVTDTAAPHIGFKVDDIDGLVAQLKADGVEFYSDPVEVDGSGDAPQFAGIRFCYCRDPNGYIVELVYEPPDLHVDWERETS